MSLPIRTLAINSKTEDFPTPVSPIRRMVYGISGLFFDVLMIPFLRDSTSLQKYRYKWWIGDVAVNLLDSRDVVPIVGVGNVFMIC